MIFWVSGMELSLFLKVDLADLGWFRRKEACDRCDGGRVIAWISSSNHYQFQRNVVNQCIHLIGLDDFDGHSHVIQE